MENRKFKGDFRFVEQIDLEMQKIFSRAEMIHRNLLIVQEQIAKCKTEDDGKYLDYWKNLEAVYKEMAENSSNTLRILEELLDRENSKDEDGENLMN